NRTTTSGVAGPGEKAGRAAVQMSMCCIISHWSGLLFDTTWARVGSGHLNLTLAVPSEVALLTTFVAYSLIIIEKKMKARSNATSTGVKMLEGTMRESGLRINELNELIAAAALEEGAEVRIRPASRGTGQGSWQVLRARRGINSFNSY